MTKFILKNEVCQNLTKPCNRLILLEKYYCPIRNLGILNHNISYIRNYIVPDR